MKQNILILCLLIGCARLWAQSADSVVYHQWADTFKTQQSEVAQTDELMWRLLEEQSLRIKQQNDSVHQYRLLHDTTTLQPFHIGYADSLRLDAERRRFTHHPLAIPMLYVPERRSSEQMVKDSQEDDVQHFTLGRLYSGARREILRHNAEVYKGVYDASLDFGQHIIADIDKIGSVEIKKTIIKEVDEERRYQLRRFRDARSPWRKQATIMLQVSQNYVSPNWYQGGSSNFALLGTVQGYINYDDKDKITWENQGEWRMGFSTVSGDSLRKVNTNDDLLKLYTKFGYKVYQNLYISTSAELQTQLFETWKTNVNELKTGPLTPIRFNLTLGIDYKPVKGLSIVFSPFTYKMVYAYDTVHVSPSTFGIPASKQELNDIGSSLRVDWSWTPVREVALDSKFYFYTNYKRVEVDWEITCNFIINRYLSARVILHPRYDNTVILPNDERARLQFKELISVGFAHKFY